MDIKNFKIIFRVIFILTLSVFTSVQAAQLSFFPNKSNNQFGNPINIDIVVSGLGEGVTPSVSSFDLTIQYESSLLHPKSVKFGAQLNNNQELFSIQEKVLTRVDGQIKISETSFLEGSNSECIICKEPYLDDFQTDSFVMATLVFDSKSIGESELNFAEVTLLASDLQATALQIDTLEPAMINVSNVPIPPSVLLFISGLFMMVLKPRQSLV